MPSCMSGVSLNQSRGRLRPGDFAKDALNVVDGILDYVPHLLGYVGDLPLHLLAGHRSKHQGHRRAGECAESERQRVTADTASFVEHADLRCKRVARLNTTTLVLGDELADGGHEFAWHFDRRLSRLLQRGFILSHRFHFALLLVVMKNLPDSLFIPSFWIPGLPHGLPFFLRRLR